MKCNEVQDLILTDYLDGQMSNKKKKELEAHLAKCNHCRDFESVTRKTVIEPFNAAERVNPPLSVWHHIRETIQQEQYETAQNPIAGFLDRLKSFRVFPKPVLAMATVIVVIFIAVVIARIPTQNQIALNDYLDEQITFLVSLDTYTNGAYNGSYVDLDTSIEEYLF